MWHLVKDEEIKLQREARVDLRVRVCTGLGGALRGVGTAKPGASPCPIPLTRRFLQAGGPAVCREV